MAFQEAQEPKPRRIGQCPDPAEQRLRMNGNPLHLSIRIECYIGSSVLSTSKMAQKLLESSGSVRLPINAGKVSKLGIEAGRFLTANFPKAFFIRLLYL